MKTTSDRRLPVLALLVPAMLAAALTGCSGSDGALAGAPVASVAGQNSAKAGADPGAEKNSGSGAKTDAEVEAQRPQLRVDSTEVEKARLMSVWANCLKQYGVPTYEKSRDNIKQVFPGGEKKEYPEAYERCAGKQPLTPAATDPQRNPDYADDFHEYVKCVNRDSKIIKIRQTGDGWTYTERFSVPDATWDEFNKVDKACELEAFGSE
jgi:hypothetical protein